MSVTNSPPSSAPPASSPPPTPTAVSDNEAVSVVASNAEESDAVESNVEESTVEDSSAEESNAEESNAEESNAESDNEVDDNDDDEVVQLPVEEINTETVGQMTTVLKEAFGSTYANELLLHQLQLYKKTPRTKTQTTHAAKVLRLKHKEALGKVEQLQFENELLKQKLIEWEQWRVLVNVGKKATTTKPNPTINHDIDLARAECNKVQDIDSSTNQVYYQLHSPTIQIYTSSIKDLCNGLWLDDTVIDAFFSILARELCRIHGESYAITMSSQFTKYILTNHREQPDILQQLALMGYKIGTTSYVFLPLHYSDLNHWCLAWIDMSKKKFTFFNTLARCKMDAETCYNNSLCYFEEYSSILSKTPFDDKGWTFDYNLDYKQLDTDNCGVHICMLAYMMAVDGNADEWNGGKKACKEYRELILGVIQAYCKKVYVG